MTNKYRLRIEFRKKTFLKGLETVELVSVCFPEEEVIRVFETYTKRIPLKEKDNIFFRPSNFQMEDIIIVTIPFRYGRIKYRVTEGFIREFTKN